jgi:DNA-binding HxlR family transcriptional regulator
MLRTTDNYPRVLLSLTRFWSYQATYSSLAHMLNSEYSGENCSVARALEVVGERWTLLIVRDLLTGPHRFAELQRKLGIAKNVLTVRLQKLVDEGIAEKVPYTGARNWNDYRLTRKGKDLFPVLSALMAWGDRYAAPQGGPPLIFEHECGHAAGHKMVCAYCGDDLIPRTVRVIPGPGATTNMAPA